MDTEKLVEYSMQKENETLRGLMQFAQKPNKKGVKY
jgi:hypothetical protein